MRRMKCAIAGLLGLLAGFTACYCFSTSHAQHRFEDMFYVTVLTDLDTGQKIHEGKTAKILESVESRMPGAVLSIRRDFYRHPGAKYFLWRIKMYYKDNGVALPASIMDIMTTVPDVQPTDDYIFYNQQPNDLIDKIKGTIQSVGR